MPVRLCLTTTARGIIWFEARGASKDFSVGTINRILAGAAGFSPIAY